MTIYETIFRLMPFWFQCNILFLKFHINNLTSVMAGTACSLAFKLTIQLQLQFSKLFMCVHRVHVRVVHLYLTLSTFRNGPFIAISNQHSAFSMFDVQLSSFLPLDFPSLCEMKTKWNRTFCIMSICVFRSFDCSISGFQYWFVSCKQFDVVCIIFVCVVVVVVVMTSMFGILSLITVFSLHKYV